MFGLAFDPNAEVERWEHHRPHWAQSGAVVFVTFRTHDSIPREVVLLWDRLKLEWLHHRGVQCTAWHRGFEQLNAIDRANFLHEFQRLKDICLDECLGTCVLRRPELAQIVSNSLLHFDGQQYQMGVFVVMPNHVHLLAVFSDAQFMKNQFASWLRFTATQINRAIGRSGSLWQEEPFDHLVRSAEQFDWLRRYIAENPTMARLLHGEFLYRRRPECVSAISPKSLD